MERLDKFISNQGMLSRSQVKEAIKKGLISVNGIIAKKSDIKINPNSDVVKVSEEIISFKKHIYLMLNKPKGVVCSTKDELSKTVLSLVPEQYMRKGLFPAGRLDKDTEGFVLITDDGEMAHKMLSPKNHVPKKYYVELLKPAEDFYIDKFKKGMVLSSGEKCLPADILINETDKNKVEVIIRQGMFHQIKRMFEALGNKVVYLKRLEIGGLILDPTLPLGECIEILHKDIEKINDFL